ncbi:unnamed protein product [Calypogeia fissa]
MPSLRFENQVAVAGDELLVYGGTFRPKSSIRTECKCADFLAFYHPVKVEWRVVENVSGPVNEAELFVAGGRVYSMSAVSIHIYDFDRNSWAQKHSFSSLQSDNLMSYQ